MGGWWVPDSERRPTHFLEFYDILISGSVIRKRKRGHTRVQFENNRLLRNRGKRSVCSFKWQDCVCYIKSAGGTPEGLNRNTDACTSLCCCGLTQV